LEETISALKENYSKIDSKNVKLFSDLPISKETLEALKEDNFTTPTEIQKESIDKKKALALPYRGMTFWVLLKQARGKR